MEGFLNKNKEIIITTGEQINDSTTMELIKFQPEIKESLSRPPKQEKQVEEKFRN